MGIVFLSKARRGGRGKPSPSELEALANRMSSIVAANLAGDIKTFRKKLNYDHMADAVYSGNYAKVFDQMPWDKLEASVQQSFGGLSVSMADASAIAARELYTSGVGTEEVDARKLSLFTDNPKIDSYLKVRTGELVQNVTDEARGHVERAVRRAVDSGASPTNISVDLKEMLRQTIGLNDRQAVALQNYTEKLTSQGLSADAVRVQSQDYGERLLGQRAQMIARTEIAYAQNQGQEEVWSAAREAGLLPDSARRRWEVDGDPCPICVDLNGQEVGLGENFTTSDGDEIQSPPAHPNCRCQLSISGI